MKRYYLGAILGLAVTALSAYGQGACTTPASGLVSWWPGEGNATDVAGSNPGLFQNGTNYATAEVGQGFVMDGVSSRVRVPASASLNLGTQPGFTLEAWINPSDLAYGHPIFEWNDDNASLPGLIFWLGHPDTSTGYLHADLYDGNADHVINTAAGTIVTNVLQHVALTYDKTNGLARLFVNGVMLSEQNLGVVTVRNTGNLYIGARLGSIQPKFFKGIIDEPSVYNRPLTTNEIAAIFAAGSLGKCPLSPAAPVITQQPTDRGATVGSSTTFSAAIMGTAPLTYQWLFNGTNIDGATNAIYGINPVKVDDAGLYSLIVTNLYGSATSSNALLTIGLSPTFTQQPSNQTVSVGSPAVFSAAVTGTAPLSYQWRRNGLNISGATNLTYTIAAAQVSQAGIYTLRVTNSFGTATSSSAQLSVTSATAPKITQGPTNRTVIIGSPTTFSAIVTGTAPLSYQWLFKGTNINGATNATYSIAAAQTNQAGLYSLRVTNVAGTATSSNASLTVIPGAPPTLTQQPTDRNVVAGAPTAFSATATGIGPLAYQWLFNGTNIDGATNTTYNIVTVQENQAGLYAVSVTNLYGSATSSNALLTIVTPSTNCATPASSLVSWWPGEGNANDIIGDNLGVFQGGTNGAGTNFATAEVGLGFVMDGISSRVRVPASASLNLGTQPGFTLEAWINPSDLAYGHPIFEWNNDNASLPGLIFWLGHPGTSTGYLHADLYDGNADHVINTAAGTIVTNVLQHVALTYDKTNGLARLFVNGVMLSEQNLGVVTVRNTGNLYIGARLGSIQPKFFKGIIDEPSVYNRALTTNEIADIFAAGSLGKCPLPPAPPTLAEQPTNRTVVAGSPTSFSVTANGAEPLAYQWLFNGTNIDGATNTTYSIASLQENQAGLYSVNVTNLYGSATSSNALLTIVTPSTNCATPASGLVSWWPGEGNATDVAGSNPGLFQNGTNYATAEVGQGFVMDGISSRVRIPASANLNLGTQPGFTLEAWINPSDLAYGHPIFEWNDDNASLPGLIFWLGHPNTSTGYLLADLYDGNADHVLTTAAGTIVTNVLQHVALTYDKTNGLARLFVNGVMLIEQNLGVVTVRNTGNLYIGARLGSIQPKFFKGIIDEPSVYNRALTTNEIAAIFAAGSSGKCPLPPVPPTLAEQPANRTVVAGSPTSFSVTANGTAPLAYQWLFNGTNINGATNTTYNIASVQEDQTGLYSVSVTNLYGSALSSNALLTVTPAPTNPPTECVMPSSGLISWWPGESNTTDIVGSNSGVYENGTNFAPGAVGKGFALDGIDDRVRVPASTNLNLGTQPGFTLEAWINPSDLAYGHPIFEWNDDNATLPGLIFWLGHPGTSTGYLHADLYDGNADHVINTAAGTIVTNVLQHVALTYDKTNGLARLFVNGVMLSEQNLGVVTVRNTGNLYIGARLGSIQPKFFKGIIDEPSVYNRALTTNEIAAIFAAGNSGKCLPETLPPPPDTPMFTRLITEPLPVIRSINVAAGHPHLSIAGPSGRVYVVEASTSSGAWEPLGEATETSSGFYEFDDNSPQTGLRYYRIATPK